MCWKSGVKIISWLILHVDQRPDLCPVLYCTSQICSESGGFGTVRIPKISVLIVDYRWISDTQMRAGIVGGIEHAVPINKYILNQIHNRSLAYVVPQLQVQADRKYPDSNISYCTVTVDLLFRFTTYHLR